MNVSTYVNNLFNAFINNSDVTLGNILFIRDNAETAHQNKDAIDNIYKIYGKGFYAHSFSVESMVSPFEPFIDAIKYYYDTFYSSRMNAKFFIEKCGIYKLHEVIFTSFLETGVANRVESVIISEISFEQQKMLNSIISILNYISRDYKILLALNHFQDAGLATMDLVKQILTSHDGCDAKIMIVFNDNRIIPSYRQEALENVLYIADENCIIFDMESTDLSETKAFSSFSPSPILMEEYNRKITNLYYFLNLGDLDYYIDIIHSRIIEENFSTDNDSSFYFYSFAALCSLMMGNDNRAVFMCERLPLYYNKNENPYYDYKHNYINCMIHVALRHSELGEKYAQLCLDQAQKLGDDELIFSAKVLKCSAQFGGWRNVFNVNFSTIECNEQFIKELNDHEYYNTLAYYLVYGFDNDITSLSIIASGELTKTYQLAFDYINSIGNTALLLSAYTKYIVLLNTSGFHTAVNKFYDAKLRVLQREENKRRMANLYMGKGYNNIINENYNDANEAFTKATKILYKLKEPEAIAEALYNMVLNCFCAEDYRTAKEFLRVIFKMLANLDLKSIQIASPAKLYALDAISQYKTGSEYRCFLSLKKIKKMVDIRTGNNLDFKFISNNPHEDLFVYYLISAVLNKSNGRNEQALKEFDLAYDIFHNVSSVAFYAITFFVCEYYDLLMSLNMVDEANKLLEFAYDHCQKNCFYVKCRNIEAFTKKHPTYSEDLSGTFSHEEINNILSLSYSVGKEHQLLKDKKNIWFLSSWQELLNHENFKANELLDNALNTFQDNFNFENMLYVEINNDEPNVLYHNFDNDKEATLSIFEYFTHYRKEFIANCTDKDFNMYEPFLKMVNNSDTFTIIGIPVFNENNLTSFFAGTINNQNHDISILNSDDLAIMRTAIIQLHYAIDRINSRENIIKINEKLNELAITDLLTGLYNRQGMAKIMDFHKNSDILVSILYIDLDNFKFYNDNFGHDAGDMILKEFAKLLQNIIGKIGHVIRYGGDEFLVLLYNSTVDIATDTAKDIYANITASLIPKIRDYVGQDAVIPDDKLLTCSIGIAESPNSSTSEIYSSLKKADDALYSMKKTTKGNYCIWNKSISSKE